MSILNINNELVGLYKQTVIRRTQISWEMKTGKVKMDISGAFCIFILNVLPGTVWTHIHFDIKTLPSDSDIETDICGSDPTDNAYSPT